jgi:hypothetical protein
VASGACESADHDRHSPRFDLTAPTNGDEGLVCFVRSTAAPTRGAATFAPINVEGTEQR